MDLKVLIDTIDENCNEDLQCSILYYMPVDLEVRNNIDSGQFYWNSVAYIRSIIQSRNDYGNYYYQPCDRRVPPERLSPDGVWSGNHGPTKDYLEDLLNEYHRSNKII